MTKVYRHRELIDQREPKLPAPFNVELVRDKGGNAATNVPWSCIMHSPLGFEWGYAGSGPADLALNILNAFIPPQTDEETPVACAKGWASYTAYKLHQQFKEHFLAPLDHAGGNIGRAAIELWLEQHAPKKFPPIGYPTPDT